MGVHRLCIVILGAAKVRRWWQWLGQGSCQYMQGLCEAVALVVVLMVVLGYRVRARVSPWACGACGYKRKPTLSLFYSFCACEGGGKGCLVVNVCRQVQTCLFKGGGSWSGKWKRLYLQSVAPSRCCQELAAPKPVQKRMCQAYTLGQ